MNQPELGKKILELRQNKGLTQGELAENCNLSLRTVQRIESAEVTPRSHTVRVVFSCLEYDLHNSSSNTSEKKYQTTIWMEQVFRPISELFNLKKNTMRKVTVLSLVVVLTTIGLLLGQNELKTQKIDGWFLAGSKPGSYMTGLDKAVYQSGSSSAFLESKAEVINGFGTLMQACGAEEYLGKKIKMTAYIKSDNVTEWAGMWLRVDSRRGKKMLSFDNMQDRSVKGSSDWTKCEIILDVPLESGTLNFGVLLSGTGKVWFDNIAFEAVENVEPTKSNLLNSKPLNLDFGE